MLQLNNLKDPLEVNYCFRALSQSPRWKSLGYNAAGDGGVPPRFHTLCRTSPGEYHH